MDNARGLGRSAGVLLHVTSLPGAHGIGDLGPAAYAWVTALAQAGQSWWQILPLGPTGYGDSPYQCFSAFAGNPNLISLEQLMHDGLLNAGELPTEDFPASEVDYARVIPAKERGTAAAWRRFHSAGGDWQRRFQDFAARHSGWLEPFALFVAVKERHGGVAWQDWPEEVRTYEPPSLTRAAHELEEQVELHKFRQFLFFDQWSRLREHAHRQGIRFIGDMPIFIASDSADVWSRPELFELDERRLPKAVAGVPPDYFSSTGQLWGNPLYAWDQHRETNFAWWTDRLRATLQWVDLVRLDHFRGFEAYWAVPFGSKTAESGAWIPGPGAELFQALQRELGSLPLIAEDLGVITPQVDALRQQHDLPGMRILQFAFGGAQEDRFLPHRYENNTVVYTGTHDNDTSRGWYESMTPGERESLDRYAPTAGDDPAWKLIRLAWASVADLAVTPLQDVLSLGTEARMNLPGRATGNWKWRVEASQLAPDRLEKLGELTAIYQRQAQRK
jgi:4-alpha-glucanotransferase